MRSGRIGAPRCPLWLRRVARAGFSVGLSTRARVAGQGALRPPGCSLVLLLLCHQLKKKTCFPLCVRVLR